MRAAGNASKNVFARLCLFGGIPALRPRREPSGARRGAHSRAVRLSAFGRWQSGMLCQLTQCSEYGAST